MAHAISTPTLGFGLTTRIRAAYEEFKSNRTKRVAYIATYKELNALTYRDLEDLGMNRYDLRDIAQAHVYGQ